MAIWSGTQLYLVDRNGNATYNDMMEGNVQFARVGERYLAVVVGEETSPKLNIKDLNGAQVDVEANAYSGLMLLDTGFYGDQGQYLWTLSLDVFGTAPNTVLHTFQVGKMNSGQVSLGKDLTYKVIYENGKLRVFPTKRAETRRISVPPARAERTLPTSRPPDTRHCRTGRKAPLCGNCRRS